MQEDDRVAVPLSTQWIVESRTATSLACAVAPNAGWATAGTVFVMSGS